MRLLAGVGIVFLLVFIGLVFAYAARREIARQTVVGWFDAQGVDADVRFERIDLNGLVASIRAGDSGEPDLTVERLEVDYRLGFPGAGGSWLRPTRIRLVRPEVRASLAEGRISLGSLDPILESFQSRPPTTDTSRPTILIEQGRLRLATAGGTLEALADAELRDNRLIRLDARVPAARLRDPALTLDLARAGVAVRTVGDHTALAIEAVVDHVGAAGLSGDDGTVRAVVSLPYPDLGERRVEGPTLARLGADLASATWQEGSAHGLDADLTLQGRAAGWIEAFSLNGGLSGRLTADQLNLSDASLNGVAVALDGRQVEVRRDDGLSWSYRGDGRLSAAGLQRGDAAGRDVSLTATALQASGNATATTLAGELGLRAGAIGQGDLSLTGVTGAFDLNARLADDGATSLAGSLRSGGGAWRILGPVGRGDGPEQAALKRAFEAFALDMPALALTVNSGATRIELEQPARIRPTAGGEVTISARDGAPVYAARPGAPGGGSLILRAEGGGLPTLHARVTNYVVAEGAITALVDAEAAMDFGLARGLRLEPAGLLRIVSGRTTFAAASCFPVRVERLDLGENDVQDVSASLCPTSGSMLTVADGWRFEAEARGLGAQAPFLGMAVSDATARLVARDPGGRLGLTADIRTGLVSDMAAEPRFHPLRGHGQIALADDTWTGHLQLNERSVGHRVMDVDVRHSGRSGAGGVRLDATGLTFAPQALQPSQITPLAETFVRSPVTGTADFTGHIDWTGQGLTSGGRFVTPGLDFVSPLGPVQQMRGEVTFLSLVPLVTAADQHMTVSRINAFVPLTDVTVNLGLDANTLHVEGTRVAVAGGFVTLEPADIPFDPSESWEGVLVLDRVQLGDLFAASGFADAVQLDAVVSGRLPFIYGPSGLSIVGGSVHSDQPGRLSIARSALTGMTAGGGGEQVPPSTVQDFAYQALEHLSFSHLNAELNSLPQGRLGVLFTINGRHDPPVEQEIRLSIDELIRREFLDRILPLPSDTQINLTLDTSFNLDQLISDLMEIQRARGLSERNR